MKKTPLPKKILRMAITALVYLMIGVSSAFCFSFDIPSNESIVITLPPSCYQMLIKVIGNPKHDIFGDISTNGLKILVNSNGIYISPNTKSNTKNYAYQKLSREQLNRLLINVGKTNVRREGFGILVGGVVENSGTVVATLGKAVIAGAKAVRLDIAKVGKGLISIAIDEDEAGDILDYIGRPISEHIKDSGAVKANSGVTMLDSGILPDIFEKIINLKGIAKAGKVKNSKGRISLVANYSKPRLKSAAFSNGVKR